MYDFTTKQRRKRRTKEELNREHVRTIKKSSNARTWMEIRLASKQHAHGQTQSPAINKTTS